MIDPAHQADEFAAIVRGASDAIIGKSRDGVITSWNAGAERLYGYTSDEIVGKPITELIPADRIDEEKLILDKVQAGEELAPYFTQRRRKDGTLVDISLTVAPIRNAAGAIVGASAIARDITALQSREAQLSALIEAAPDAFIVVDRTGAIEFVNQQTETLFGYQRSELQGQRIDMLVPDRVRDRHPGLRQAFSADPSARPMRGRNLSGRRKDGSEFSVDISLTPLHTERGLLIAAAVRDATERKQAEARYEALLEAAPDAIVVVDEAGNITVASHRTKDLFGYTREELIGQPVELLIPVKNRPGHPKLRSGFFKHPDVRPMGAGLQLWAVRKDGSEFPVDISLSPLQTTTGTLVSAAVRDITDRLRTEDALREAKVEAERANDAKSEFLSRMSHELRTPLTAILGFTELLQMGGVPDDQHDAFIDRTHKAGQHLLSLVNDVLDISRVQSGTLAISIEPVAIGPVVQEVIDLLSPMAAQRRIEIRNRVRGHVVRADMNRLKQILLNLLSNAVKYNREGGTVTVSTAGEDPMVAIAVEDTGPGIAAADLPRLFQPFERLGIHTGEIEGTGIGLALSQALTEMMGGSVQAESTVGMGSRFTVRLPQGELAEGPERANVDVGTIPAPTATVLYIEDNPSNTVLVEGALSLRPHIRVVSAALGRLGLDLAREHRPDLILLDLHLPDINGDEVLLYLRADERTAAIPVIVVSADATQRRIGDMLQAGATAYVTKPLVIRDFLRTVDEVLAAHANS
ncbi:MAG: PAS domain S-box protein [Aeromicrobium sp.]